ncbi:VOC family protein [Mediterraneibacter sp. NSJ-55]|uniref:VOC family protein n=1 Tax=Mediterraneibacter hominis TaxID=2763054 RepID=A0A923LIV9_9FIRM|nr:VOC family protein [Mediterraneibacter hominis]MBC5689074.1 VOC family protein [Mediterraneibacter hominis]
MSKLEELGFELRHVGINCADEEEADNVAGRFDEIFGFSKKTGNSSVFAGTAVEAMKTPYLGKNGHIAIGTTDIEKAAAYLKEQGVEIDMETAKYKNEKLIAVYIKEEIGGFAVHLVQK